MTQIVSHLTPLRFACSGVIGRNCGHLLFLSLFLSSFLHAIKKVLDVSVSPSHTHNSRTTQLATASEAATYKTLPSLVSKL
jgi:hypothetical protein